MATQKSWSGKKKGAVAATVVGGAIIAYLLWPRPASALSAKEVGATSVKNANGSVTVTASIVAQGGVGPYSYRVDWLDGTADSNLTGTFTRTFAQASLVPAVALLTATSIDGQTITIDG